MPQSEVVQLRIKIEEELHAMRQGLSGLGAGNSKHQLRGFPHITLVSVFFSRTARTKTAGHANV